jgi:hypothetical protein
MAKVNEKMATETYQAVEKLILKLCWEFHYRTRIPFDECKGIANEAFMDAYHSYDGSISQFTTYVHSKITGKFRNMATSHISKAKGLKKYSTRKSKKKIDLERLFLDLSMDAARVLRLLIRPDAEVKEILEERRINNDRRADTVYKKVIDKLGIDPMTGHKIQLEIQMAWNEEVRNARKNKTERGL